jgi:hypothetical protein
MGWPQAALAGRSGPHLAFGAPVGSSLADEDDAKLPVLSTWQSPEPPSTRDWILRQLKAGALGLVLGLAVVVPSVLWLTGRLGGQQHQEARSGGMPVAAASLTQPEPSPQRDAAMPSIQQAETAPVLVTTPKPVLRPPSEEKEAVDPAEELLARAEGLVGDGEMLLAREVLGASVLENNPKAAFALAETFDPNILAATGARGVRAEVERARTLYAKALSGGIALAQRRLDALR